MRELAQFDDAWMAEFRKKSGLTDEVALAALRTNLVEIGRHYRRVIETTPCDIKGSPFNKTLTQRGDWLQSNVVRPTERLLAALAEENRAYFSTWPHEEKFEAFPDRERLRADLQATLDFSTRLLGFVRGEQSWDAGTNQELRYYIFKDIVAAVRKHLPDFQPRQGVYQQLEDEKTKRRVDPFPEAIRHIFAEITGRNEQLVRLIRSVVKDPDWEE